ncbi:(E)-beta-farnesene synthase-like isoform X2 [Pistacia vera]|uniref:(E)-beta-farnesene synthase-like isoform X2 n=1 Tax=Pistacia vera TaxID=55513 RepID=UPI0012631DF2|nr:(E)-beta-farnesene synthase-like isoform X2 [Pistacia vera]
MSSSQVTVVPTSPPKTIRHTADFHPTIWGDQFLKDTSELKTIDPTTQEDYEQLKQEVKWMIMDTSQTNAQKLHLIDAIQRLGVDYHFPKEIDDALEKIYSDNIEYNDLYTVSIHFRLLRQQGIKIVCNVFEKFKDDEGKFKASLINDVPGMLNLYEAAHFAIHGEDILDEALTFTTTHLKSMVSCASPHPAKQINHALNCPLRKGLPRLEARFFISVYSRDDLHNKTLLKFAKLDFNMLQAMYQKDLKDVLQWWNDVDFISKLPYARQRMVEEYFWALGIIFEPQYAFGIRSMAKLICLITLIDDTYDSYGTIEELTLFTEAVKKWDFGAADMLPDYMKLIYKTLFDFFGEMEECVVKKGEPCYINSPKFWMQRIVQGYFAEARWLNEGYIPTTFEEYISLAAETSAVELMTSVAFFGMDDIATKEDFDWISTNPKIINTTRLIGRLMNDIGSSKFEQKRGHIPSGVKCYMKQHGVSNEEAVEAIMEHVSNAWKDVNEEMLKPTAISRSLLERVLNYSRVIHILYKDDYDAFTDAYKLKDQVILLLKDPVPPHE